MPALWLGTESTAASDPDNWSDGMLPTEWDVVQFSDAYPVDCVGLSGNFSVLSMSSGYNATVTLGGSAHFTEFSMGSGTLIAPSTLSVYTVEAEVAEVGYRGTLIAPSTLSVYTGYMDGGTLDVQSSASFWGLSMDGGSATIGGAATFDNLSLYNTASVTLESGGTAGLIQIQSGALTIEAPVTAGVFHLSGGQLVQAATSATLTVGGVREEWSGDAFSWSGGTLNSSSSLANVNITGTTTTALFAPTNGSTVATGSHINLDNGAVATVREGTFQFLNEAIVKINAATLNADPGNSKEINIEATNFGGQINLNVASSVWNVWSGKVNSTGSLKNTAGTFTLGPSVLATFTGAVDDVVDGPAVLQAGGTLNLYKGSILDVGSSTQALLVSGGKLSINLDAGTGPAEIVGHVKITGGDIISANNASGDTHLFGEIRVEGNIHWLGGTFRPFVSAAFEEDSDTLYATGAITIEGAAALAPGAVDGE